MGDEIVDRFDPGAVARGARVDNVGRATVDPDDVDTEGGAPTKDLAAAARKAAATGDPQARGKAPVNRSATPPGAAKV